MKLDNKKEKDFVSFDTPDTKGAKCRIFEQDNLNVGRIDLLPCIWFSTEQAANYLNLSVNALLNMTSNGKVPYFKLARRNRYKKADLDSLLERNRKGPRNGN
jgi:excisionase family DNA binding protein